MPRHEASPSAVTAAFSVLPKDHYVFKIGEAKAFANKEKGSYGIRYSISVESPDAMRSQKPAPINCYQHNEPSQGMTKQFLMAAYGFKLNSEGEKAFNEATKSLDWTFDTDTGEIGDGWTKINGGTVEADVDIRMGKGDYAGTPNNSFKWMPLATN